MQDTQSELIGPDVARMDPQRHVFYIIARFVEPGAKLLRAWSLTGGVSAETTALEIATHGGGVRRMVVHRHEPAKLRKRPHLAREEFELLKALHSGGMPVPQPLHVDETGEILPTPYLVLAYVEAAEFSPRMCRPWPTACRDPGPHPQDRGCGRDVAFPPASRRWPESAP